MNSINWPASSIWIFIAQLGEHCSDNAEATGSNPVEAPKNFFSGYFRNCLNCDSLRWSHTHFICIPAVHIISFSEESIVYKISKTDLNKILDDDIYPDDDHPVHMNKTDFEKILMESDYRNREKYEIEINTNRGEVNVINKPITLTYKESDMNKNLMNKESIDLLQFYRLQLPAYYKEKSLKELQEALNKSQKISSQLKDKLKNAAEYDDDDGKRFAYPKSKSPRPGTSKLIAEHNITGIYNYNLNQLREFKEKTGTGILHFSNPLQLLDRLELLGGSILAGNNGVLQAATKAITTAATKTGEHVGKKAGDKIIEMLSKTPKKSHFQ